MPSGLWACNSPVSLHWDAYGIFSPGCTTPQGSAVFTCFKWLTMPMHKQCTARAGAACILRNDKTGLHGRRQTLRNCLMRPFLRGPRQMTASSGFGSRNPMDMTARLSST